MKKIGKQAFYGCKNLKKITIKTTKLTVKNVGKKAFAKLNSNVVISVPTSKLTAYRKLLKTKGVTGKKQTVKSSGTSYSSAPKKPTAVPNPQVRFAIGELTNVKDGVKDLWMNTSTDASYESGDSMKFTLCAKMPHEMYGYWGIKKMRADIYARCIQCKKLFDDHSYDLGTHQDQTDHYGFNWIVKPTRPSTKIWSCKHSLKSCWFLMKFLVK